MSAHPRVMNSALRLGRLGVAQSVSYRAGRFTPGARQADDERRRFGWSGRMRSKNHGGAQVVLLDAWRSARALGYRWDHLFKGHIAPSEVAHGLHVNDRDSVGLPLGDSGRSDVEVRCEGCGAALLSGKPGVQVHAQSLVATKPQRQVVSKPAVVSIRLTMDAERRQRFKDWFAGPPCRGSRAKLMELTEYTKGRVAQLFDPKQPFGEKAAHELARRLKLPDEHYFERAAVPAPARTPNGHIDFNARAATESQWAVLDDLDALPDAEREKIVAQIREQAAVFKAYRQQVIEKIAAESKGHDPAGKAADVKVIQPTSKPVRRTSSPVGVSKHSSKKAGVR